jgi:predicted small lipoprotein YifL
MLEGPEMTPRAVFAWTVMLAAIAIALCACGGRSGLYLADPDLSDAGARMRPGDAGMRRPQMADAAFASDDATSTSPSPPLGAYGECTVTLTTMSIPMATSGGAYGPDSTTLTLTQNGSVVTVTAAPGSTSIDSVGFSLDFVASTNTSASLSPVDQPFAQFSSVTTGCNVTTLASGSITFDASMLYLSIVGLDTDDAGAGCQATATFACAKE